MAASPDHRHDNKHNCELLRLFLAAVKRLASLRLFIGAPIAAQPVLNHLQGNIGRPKVLFIIILIGKVFGRAKELVLVCEIHRPMLCYNPVFSSLLGFAHDPFRMRVTYSHKSSIRLEIFLRVATVYQHAPLWSGSRVSEPETRLS
jgi:hypothetical protein